MQNYTYFPNLPNVYRKKHLTIYHDTSQMPMHRAFGVWYMFTQHILYMYYTCKNEVNNEIFAIFLK